MNIKIYVKFILNIISVFIQCFQFEDGIISKQKFVQWILHEFNISKNWLPLSILSNKNI